MGRQTLLPAADAPDPTQGDVTLGYFDTDLPAWVQQNSIRTTYTLDVASHRLVSTIGPNGGTATSTTTRHYSDGSDNQAWVDFDNDAADRTWTSRLGTPSRWAGTWAPSWGRMGPWT